MPSGTAQRLRRATIRRLPKGAVRRLRYAKWALVGAPPAPPKPATKLPAVASSPAVYGLETPAKPAPPAPVVPPLRDFAPDDISRGGTPVRTSRPVARADFDTDWLKHWRELLAQPYDVHRKLWEWCEILQAAQDAGVLEPGRSAVGFGVGVEPLPALLAHLGLTVVATDAPVSDDSTKWADTNQHAAAKKDLIQPHLDVDAATRLITFEPWDMRADLTPLGQHDLVWSSCVIEHLGSPAKGLDFVRRSLELLKPGGVAVHTTEMEVTPHLVSRDYGSCAVYSPEDLQSFFQSLPPGYSYAATFGVPTQHEHDRFVDVPPYGFDPSHLKLVLRQSVTTSFSITVVRDR